MILPKKNFRQKSIKKNLLIRAGIIQALRNFFIKNNYIEVDTPCRIPTPAPEANIHPMASYDWFLQTSPELCMKRLLAQGYSRIFQVCKCFRKNERGVRHLPEFLMLEWYSAGTDYVEMMDQCEELIRFTANSTGFGDNIIYQGKRVNLSKGWTRMTIAEAFEEFASISLEKALKNDLFDEVTGLEIEPNLGLAGPVFLYDYPAKHASLARLKHGNKSIAERFELYICGLELCNAFSELNDPVEQRLRFENELKLYTDSNNQAMLMPDKFLEALGSMPDASGSALGIDRLVMLFTDSIDIDEVTAFIPEEL